MIVPEAIIETILNMKNIVVIGHVTPDADALASMLAIAKGFAEPGVRKLAISLPENAVSQRLAFLIEQDCPPRADRAAFEAADGFIVLDTARIGRCCLPDTVSEDWTESRTIINVDHHTSNTEFGTYNWIEAEAASTSELAYELLAKANRTITPEMASALYSGILTDTVGFTVATAGQHAFKVAGELVRLGADAEEVGERIHQSLGEGEFQLLRVIYDNTKTDADGLIAYSTANHEEIVGAGCSASDIDEQVNVPRSISGAKIALLLTEGVSGKTRINFRGKGGMHVLGLAKRLGGGGHNKSAGAILEKPLEESIPVVLKEARAWLQDCGNEPGLSD